MAVTLKDIAAAAGVSIGTVERALKNRDRIKPEVAERIRALAKEMNYRPNTVASGLVNRTKKYKIAVVVNIINDFWQSVTEGIQQAQREIRDYGILVQIYSGDGFDEKMQLRLINQAIEEEANALVIAPINSPAIAERILKLHEDHFPVVFLNTYLSDVPVLSSIHCDYYRTGRIAGALIRKLSHGNGDTMAIIPSMQVLGNYERRNGIDSFFTEHPDGGKLAQILELSNNEAEDTSRIIDILTANPSVTNLIFNGDTRICLEVLAHMKRPLTTIVFDLSSDSRDAILAGRIDAIIGQSQKEQGYEAIIVLFQYLTSGKIPPHKILKNSEIYIKECLE